MFILLFPVAATAADVPNIFDPRKVSSETIAYGVSACVRSGYKALPKIGLTPWFRYCSCAADAIRRKISKGVNIKCARYTASSAKVSPYFNKKMVVSSMEVAVEVATCVDIAVKVSVPTDFALAYCGCVSDARRHNRISGNRGLKKGQEGLCRAVAILRMRPPAQKI